MRTKVLEVANAPSGALAGAAIDRPAPGDERADWTLDVRGWAVGQDSPVQAVEALHADTVLWRVPLTVERPRVAARFGRPEGEPAGFYAIQSVLGLPRHSTVHLRAVLEDGATAAVGTIAVEREPLRTSFEPRRQPILITTFGRTGSMLLMRLVSSHPEVLAYKPYRFEQRIVSYWLDTLLALAEPASYLRGVAPQGAVEGRLWWTGMDAPMPWPLRDEDVQDWLGGDALEALARDCQERIDALYERIAKTAGDEDARFFPEKSNLRVASVAADLYPHGRELFLVRDFRDMVCSVFAYNRKRGVTGFGRARANSDAEYVESLRGWADALVQAWMERRERAHVVRYEDLVQDPEPALAGLLEYVGVDARPDTVRGMLNRLAEDVPELREHPTSRSAQSSIGRWHAELDPDVVAACDHAFGRALEVFGYAGARR